MTTEQLADKLDRVFDTESQRAAKQPRVRERPTSELLESSRREREAAKRSQLAKQRELLRREALGQLEQERRSSGSGAEAEIVREPPKVERDFVPHADYVVEEAGGGGDCFFR